MSKSLRNAFKNIYLCLCLYIYFILVLRGELLLFSPSFFIGHQFLPLILNSISWNADSDEESAHALRVTLLPLGHTWAVTGSKRGPLAVLWSSLSDDLLAEIKNGAFCDLRNPFLFEKFSILKLEKIL